MNAEAIGETDERAGHAEFVHAAAATEVRRSTHGPTRRSTASIGCESMTSGRRILATTRLHLQVETALEALDGVGDVSVQSELLPDDHFDRLDT